jgi:hypothetical protein
MSKFKVGDKVRIERRGDGHYVGQTGTVAKINFESPYPYTVLLAGGHLSVFHAGEMITEPPTPETAAGGTKHDSGKPPLTLVPKAATELEAKVYAFGAKKYGRYNYKKGFEYSRLLDAALRHLQAFNDGEDNDPESGMSHLGHARCCIGMLIDCIELGTATDDRYKREAK